jgi:hypothetical protein
MFVLRAFHLVAVAALVIGSADADAVANFAGAGDRTGTRTVQVAGQGVDLLNAAIVHSTELTQTGKIQKSTETIELSGDLNGRVLYHVTSVFDFVQGTLVNTGNQVYSGTIAGSAPVMIHDDQFRFTVNLATGEESGEVSLFNHISGPKVRCSLTVAGTGVNSEGNPTFTYRGQCTFRGR